MFRHIISPEVELLLLQPYHAEDMFDLIDRNREHLKAWLPWVDDIVDVDDCRSNRQRALERFAFNGSFDAGIWYKGRFAGVVGLHQIDWNNRKTAIGYWLGAEFEGKGLMTMACSAIIDHCFESLNLNRLEIRAATGNTRSRAIPERLGFRHEGTLSQYELLYENYNDMEVYSLLKEEWLSRRPDHT